MQPFSGSGLLARLKTVWLQMGDAAPKPIRIMRCRAADTAFLATMEGVNDRNGADLLRGGLLLVERDALPPLPPSEFYACDVEGGAVWLDGEIIGTVKEVIFYPASTVIVVERSRGGTIDVPLLAPFVTAVLPEEHRVMLGSLEGLE